MYTFSGKLKTVSLVLMIIGALGIGYGFFSAPKTTEDVEQALAHGEDAHHDGAAATLAAQNEPDQSVHVW